MNCASPVSPWIERWAHLLTPGSSVLDLACGQGRHTRFLQARGHALTGVDRDAQALAALALSAASARTVCADIENGPWPLDGQQFDAVVITNYLWRPLWPQILHSVATGGVLLYETFALGNERYGKPSNPDFLLRPGELLQVCAGWNIVAYEHGVLAPSSATSSPRVVQRIAAKRPGGDGECQALAMLNG